MSTEVVQQIIGRAATDARFREELFTDTDFALSPFGLTKEDFDMLARLDPNDLSEFAKLLNERITESKWIT